MKKFLLIGLIVSLVFIIVGGAGIVYARVRGIDNNAGVTVYGPQNGDKIVRQFGNGPGGMMQGYGYGPGGMMQGFGYGPGGMMQGYGYGPGGKIQGYGNGPGGMMGERGDGYGPGMMGGRGFGLSRGEGLMHDYMVTAFANTVGLTVDDVNTRLEGGETFKQIAVAQGITEDKLPELVSQVQKAALDQAVADGVITQAQADLMLEHMNKYMGPGFGPGFKQDFDGCPMWDGDESQQP